LPPLAAASWDGVAESIHFYTIDRWLGNDGPAIDFGRVPQRIMEPCVTNELQRAGTSFGYACRPRLWWEVDNEARFNRIRARNFEVRGQYRRALRAYRLSDTTPAFNREREELFQAAHFETISGLQAYLKARYRLDYGFKGKGVPQDKYFARTKTFLAIRAIEPTQTLKPFIAYTLAAESPLGPERAHRYLAAYKLAPKSPRAEEAFVMSIRSLLSERKAGKPSPQDVKEAKNLLLDFLKKYPHTRFYHNALGWLGRCAFLRNDVEGAMAYYARQTSKKFPEEQRWQGYESIAKACQLTGRPDGRILAILRQRSLHCDQKQHIDSGDQLRNTFGALTQPETQKVMAAIRRDPDLLESYVAFRIEDTKLSPKGEQTLLQFSTSALSKMPKASPILVARIAQLSYNDGQYRASQTLAQRVLRSQSDPETRARARYVLAASQVRRGLPKAAIEQYKILIRDNPPDYMKRSAQEYLALLEERHGNPEHATDLYRRLDYKEDLAYMVDARLTPAQLKHYVATLRPGQTKNILTYTLGMRYLRLDDYRNARQAFQRLPKTIRKNWGLTPGERRKLEGEDHTLSYEVAPKVRDPLIVVAKLENLTRRANRGATPAGRAQALYDKAAYIYKERHLLFYSAALWRGGRAFSFDLFWSKTVNDKSDEKILERHCYEHECLAHCMKICEDLIRRYPNSPLVPKALYIEALSADHLSRLNGWWRKRKGHLVEIAVNRLNLLAQNFPHDPLAKPAKKYASEFVSEMNDDY